MRDLGPYQRGLRSLRGATHSPVQVPRVPAGTTTFLQPCRRDGCRLIRQEPSPPRLRQGHVAPNRGVRLGQVGRGCVVSLREYMALCVVYISRYYQTQSGKFNHGQDCIRAAEEYGVLAELSVLKAHICLSVGER